MKTAVIGMLIVAACVAGIAAALHVGLSWFGLPAPSLHSPTPGTSGLTAWIVGGVHQPIPQLLMQLVIIVAAARLFGSVFERFQQPPVVGEMLAGIVLGPTVVGTLFPAFSAFVFPKSSLSALQMLSQVGIILFMFVVGMELDAKLLRRKARSAVLISQVSIAVPYCLGVILSLLLFKAYAPPNSNFISFALFLGLSMSITAFPVLARIIKEKGLAGSDLGTTAISCAAVDDISAWCILALVVAFTRSKNVSGAVLTLGLAVGFLGLVFLIVKPSLERMSARGNILGAPTKGLTVLCLLTLFSSAFYTEAIGIHALFGAFLAGIAMPKSQATRDFLKERLEYFSTLLLVPIFFAFTGLRTQVGLLSDLRSVGFLAVIIAVAVVGKFCGSMGAARYSGMSWRESTAIGALMNTRGLVELIALNIGLDLGILPPQIFTMLVIMALVTTIATGPVVSWLGYGVGADRALATGLPEGT
ncbi:MAG: cation:proton antiporter domain-containing protein [Fimbriimonadaceae bacterium]